MRQRQANTNVVIDVASLISAGRFLLSQNRREVPEGPFARQAFVESAQSSIFISQVYVAHPVLHAPRSWRTVRGQFAGSGRSGPVESEDCAERVDELADTPAGLHIEGATVVGAARFQEPLPFGFEVLD